MRRIVQETRLVLLWSTRTQRLLLLSILAPALVLAAGACGVAGMAFLEPFTSARLAPLRTAFHLSIYAAGLAWVIAIAMAARELCRARRGIFGRPAPVGVLCD